MAKVQQNSQPKKKKVKNPSPILDLAEDSGFSSTAGSVVSESTDVKNEVTPTEPKDEKPDLLTLQMQKEEKKRKRREEAEQKRLEDDSYECKIQEQRYKSLMHLLDQSQFYSNYIMKKIDSVDPKEKKKSVPPARKSKRTSRSKNTVTEPVEEASPQKKQRLASRSKKNDLQRFVSDDMKQKLKRKANLSQEEIAEALAESSDEENNEPVQSKKEKKFVHPKYFNGTLYKYQQDGLQWLNVLNENGLNGILADEMGLGKTIQVIALICHLIEKKQDGPYLIVAPLSTLPNWLLEFERFAPDIPVVLLHGNEQQRRAVYSKIRRKSAVGTFLTQPVVLTTFEMPILEQSFLRNQNWRYIIVDEGHKIKNYKCLLVQVLKSCKSMNRLLLTGTPLQNNLSELWSLLNFLLPMIFNDLAVFESWFDPKEIQNEEGTKKLLKQEEEKRVMASLREILKPFMLRRIKTEVNLQIPAKKEVVVYAPITELQRDLYKAVLTRDIERMIKKEEETVISMNPDGTRPKRKCSFTQSYAIKQLSLSTMTGMSSIPSKSTGDSEDKASLQQKYLEEWGEYATITDTNCDYLVRMKFGNRATLYKQIVNHPYLVHAPMDWSGLPKIDEDLIKASGKLLVLDKMLAKLKATGHKVLLFSTMTKILDMLEDYLSMKDYLYVRLDGNTKIEDRKENIQQFNSDPNFFLFLISTRAGGVGLNLAAADTVIIYDCDWNPQMDIQAMSRCHRIGQTRPVVIYKLVTKGTIDEQILKRGEAKRKLEKMVISDRDLSSNLTDKDTLVKLRELLESKDCEVVSPDKDVFSEKELEKLLDRSDLYKLTNAENSDTKIL